MTAELLEDALAVYRLTRLATADTITEPARRSFVAGLIEAKHGPLSEDQRDAADTVELVKLTDDPPMLAVLITCRWCAGMWVAAGATVARAIAPRPWRTVARALTLASAAALVAGLEHD